MSGLDGICSTRWDGADLKQVLREQLITEQPIFDKAIETVLVRQLATAQGITATDSELQQALDEARYLRGLESAEKAMQWMRSRSLDVESVQTFVETIVLARKVKEAISAEDVAAYYTENRPNFDAVELYSIRVDAEGVANELKSQVEEDDANFSILAMEYSQDAEAAKRGGYVGWLARDQVTPEIEVAVFNAAPGAVVGPVKTSKGYNLFKVAAKRSSSLDEVAESIRDYLFAEKIAKLRNEAVISYPVLAD
jgi:parvulin-like peptidyl-prolyl isomerase